MKFDILKPQSFCEAGKAKAKEDNIFPEAGKGTVHDKLFIVADGMGGKDKGDVASASLCRSIPDFLFQNTCSDEPLTADLLHLTLLDAYKKLAQDCANGGGVMFALIYFHRQGVMAAHVGNCRIYQYRPKTHTLLYKSRDDFKAATADMVQPIEPTRKNLTNVKYGDYFVLLTKGAHANIAEEQLFAVLNEGSNDEVKLRKIRQLIGESDDDSTVSLVRVSGVMVEAIDEQVTKEPEPIPVVVAPATKPQTQVQSSNLKPQSSNLNPQPSNLNPQPSKPRPQASQRPSGSGTQKVSSVQNDKRQPLATEPESDSVKKKGGFPVIPVTALLLVALAVGFYLWSKSQMSSNEEEEEVTIVRKDTVKKDTINIMRNANAKSKANEDLFKLPEAPKTDEQKKPEPEIKRPEPETAPANNPTPAEETKPMDDAKPTTTPVTPSPTTTAPTTSPTTTAPPSDNPAPATVDPKPVIPED